VLEPIRRELSEYEFDGVDKGQLKVAEGEGSRMGVSTNLGTKVNRRKRAVRLGPNVVKDVRLKRGDKRDGVVVKVVDAREKTEEVPFYKLFRWYPKLLTAVVNDLVLVRVTVDSVSAGGGGEEVRKKID